MQETAPFCHRLGFVSVLTHEPQLDIDVLKVYSASARLVHHIITIQKLLVRLISDILIRLLKVIIHFFLNFISFFLTCRCARHGVTAYMQLRLCTTFWCQLSKCIDPLYLCFPVYLPTWQLLVNSLLRTTC